MECLYHYKEAYAHIYQEARVMEPNYLFQYTNKIFESYEQS